MPDPFACDSSEGFFGCGKLYRKVADRGAFWVPAIDGQTCTLRGKICEKPVAARAPDDVEAVQLSMKHLFKISESGSTISREVVAGLTTFAAMSYVIVVNPEIVSAAGMNR